MATVCDETWTSINHVCGDTMVSGNGYTGEYVVADGYMYSTTCRNWCQKQGAGCCELHTSDICIHKPKGIIRRAEDFEHVKSLMCRGTIFFLNLLIQW